MFKSILLPVDGSTLSYEPMHAAISLAKLTSGKLIVLSVAEPRLFNASDVKSVQDGQIIEAANIEQAKVNVQKVLERAKAENVACQAVIYMSRLVEEVINDTVLQYQCDLIVMATRGKLGVIDAIFKESVTLEVLRKSNVPVLIYPSAH